MPDPWGAGPAAPPFRRREPEASLQRYIGFALREGILICYRASTLWSPRTVSFHRNARISTRFLLIFCLVGIFYFSRFSSIFLVSYGFILVLFCAFSVCCLFRFAFRFYLLSFLVLCLVCIFQSLFSFNFIF